MYDVHGRNRRHGTINEIAAKCFCVCFTITCDSTEWYSLIVHSSEQVALPKKPGAPVVVVMHSKVACDPLSYMVVLTLAVFPYWDCTGMTVNYLQKSCDFSADMIYLQPCIKRLASASQAPPSFLLLTVWQESGNEAIKVWIKWENESEITCV